jgi:hypothetical protein
MLPDRLDIRAGSSNGGVKFFDRDTEFLGPGANLERFGGIDALIIRALHCLLVLGHGIPPSNHWGFRFAANFDPSSLRRMQAN